MILAACQFASSHTVKLHSSARGMPLQLRVPVGASRLVGRLPRCWQDVVMGEARRASMADDLNWYWADRQTAPWIEYFLEFRTAADGEAPCYILMAVAVLASAVTGEAATNDKMDDAPIPQDVASVYTAFPEAGQSLEAMGFTNQELKLPGDK